MIAEVNDYDVAIIGIAGRFPGARNVQEFWTNLRNGVESIRFLTPAELVEGGVDPAVAGDPSYVPASSSLADIEMFDAAFFGYTPRDARLLDPQGRVFLECAWEALENAACDPATFPGRIGVFASQSGSTYLLRHLYTSLAPHEFILSANNIQTVIATGNDFLATRVSYKLNLTGPSVNVQTACSSSLVAVHLARQSVLTGECDVALAGGVSIYLPHQAGYHYQEGMILSPDGHCRPFDAQARGAVFGRGAGVVVLKALSAALADGDRVLAVIKGSAINNDGAVKAGYTAPSVDGQARVIVEALANAGVAADTISYVEAHGTGTPQGDPIEVAALVSAFSTDTTEVGRCAIGSVKSNIGHLDAAAGVTGLIKTVLMLQHRELPPTLHFTVPNPQIDFASSPFRVENRLTEWRADGGPRRAGVSAFGIGGTNAHLVLEEAPPVEPRRADLERPCHLLTLSAKTPAALRALADRYADHLATTRDRLGNICHTAAIGRTHWNHRAAVLADTADRTVERLRLLAQEQLDLGVSSGQAGERPRIAFLFAGQGGQYPGMGRQLYEAQPAYRAAIDRCAASLRHELQRPLLDVMFADPDDQTIHQTQYTQPALFAVEYAMSELWRSWGIEPAAVIGHSMGEYAAACVAGAISLEEALPLVAARARLTQGAPGTGAMAAVFASEAVVARAIADVSDRVSIAAINGPEHVVLSGDEALVTARAAAFEQAGVRVQRLYVSHGFHSHLMDPVLDEFERAVQRAHFGEPRVPVISNVTGRQVTSTELGRSSYWRRHLRDTVRFSDGIQTLLQQGYRWFLEVGPHPTLTGVVRQFVDNPELHWLVSARRGQADWPQVLDALGALYVAGAPVDWRAFDDPYGHRPVVVPTYPFQRQRYWMDAAPRAAGDAAGVTLPGRRLRSPLIKQPVFETRIGTTAQPWLKDHCLFGKPVFPATGYVAAALGAALEVATGYPVVLEDITLSAPLAPPAGTTCLAQTALTSAGSDTWRFQFFSQGQDAVTEDQWTLHADGLVRKADAIPAPAPTLDDLRRRCAARVDPAEHYAEQRSRGLVFGPAFQGLVTLTRGTDEALGQVQRPDSDPDESAGDWHPGLLDCVLQTVIQAVGPVNGEERRILVPVAIERVTFYGKAPSTMWAHARVRSVAGDRYRAVVQVFDVDGRVVAEIDGLVVQRADERRLLGRATDPGDSWLYQLEWQRDGRFTTRDGDATAAGAAEPAAVAAEAASAFAPLALAEGLPRYRDMLAVVDRLCADYAERTFVELGWQPPVGDWFSTTALAAQLRVAAPHRRLLERLLEILAEDGRLIREGDRWRAVSPLSAPPVAEQEKNLLARYPEARIQLTLLGACGNQLARVIRGDVDPLQLLFPNGSVSALEALYQDSVFARVYNRSAGKAAADAIARLAARRPVRVLEVGAGTGGTTAYVLPNLPSTGVEYVFTDVSTLFLHKARQKFEQFPFVAYRMLDIEGDPIKQGFAPHQYDVIVASNVLHATADLRRTLGHVKDLLASDGLLMFVEGTGPARWVDLIFGLTEGWWKFADTDLRLSHPLLSRGRWISLLGEMGLREAIAFPEVERGEGDGWQVIGIARGPQIEKDVLARRVADCQTSVWLLLADQAGTADALRGALAANEQAAVLVRRGAAFAKTGEGGYIAAPGSGDDLRQVLADVRRHGREVKGIVDLWPLDAQVAPAAALARLEEAEALACGSALAVVQAAAGGAEQPPRLWIVTRGAQAVGRISPQALPQSLLWGFGRTVAIEHPELNVVRLDLDPDELPGVGALCEALVNAGVEDQIAVRSGERYVARLARVATLPAETEDENGVPVRLEISERGVFDNLALAPCERPVPGPGEVVIRVRATGLNFRDVLNALGMYPAPFPPLGGECAGTVEAVGEGVADLQAGEAVVALAHGSFATFAVTRREFVVPKPQTLNFADAAMVPVAFLTSAFALQELGHIRAGDRVLIHAAAGGVGLAAVQLARRAGAEVIATAGSEEKRDRLRALGISHVFDSRSADFAQGVQAATGSRGVDLVLNSLSGDLIPASLSVLSPGGRFLELGKLGIWEPARVAAARPDVEYHVIDFAAASERDPEIVARMLPQLVSEVADGRLARLPRTTFDLTNAADAFRWMAQGHHFGKIVLTQPELRVSFRGDGSYLITGGLGALGLAVSKWMVERGARHLLLMGRHAPDDHALARIHDIEALGGAVTVVQGDVANPDDVQIVLTRIASGGAPLAGVIHGAGVLDDGVLLQQSWDRFARVLRPKTAGAWNLHVATAAIPLDFFVLFSSAAALLGLAGQGNHAAANAFLDALACARRQAGLPALTINWGPWGDIGAAATARPILDRIRQQGMQPIPPGDALSLFGRLLRSNVGQMAVLPIDWSVFAKEVTHGVTPYLSRLAERSAPRPAETQGLPGTDGIVTRLRSAPEGQKRPLLVEHLREQIRRALGFDRSHVVDNGRPLNDLGLDSLMAVELRNMLGAGLELARPLPATLLFDYPTIDALAEYLSVHVLQLVPAPTAPASGSSALDEITEMSDEEAERLLLEELGDPVALSTTKGIQ